MATTFIDYTGDGNATKPFSFPSIQESDVKVEVDEVVKSSGTHYNITSYTTTGGGNVVFTSGNIPNSPSRIRIFRQTDVDTAKATYSAGSSIKAVDLNNNHKQILFGIQEEQNQTIQTHEIKDSAVTSDKIQDGAIVNADVNASAAIAGTKISPDFGSQNIATTGTVNGVTTTELAILDGATVTTAELNILDGVTATTSEVNILDGVTATTTEINKLDGVTADTSELNILDGVTATTSELNIMDGVTATTSEINTLDGVTATTTELNLLDGVTATTTELNLVDGVTATTAELNFVDGVTSNVQTQLDNKQPLDSELTTLSGMQSGTASILADGTALTATTTELNQLDGITLETSLTGTSNQHIPTSKAVNDQILAVTNALGGFVAIANETSFPATNPDPSDGAGTVVSISQISSGTAVSVSNAGVATISNGAGTGNTVTITGFPTTLRNTSLAANSGLQVQTTTTLHTYTFHKQLASADDIQAISATVNSFSNRYRVSSSPPQNSLDGGDLWYDTTNSKLMVYSSQNSAWEEATAIGNFFISTISSSSSTGGGSATANGTAYRFTISDAPTNAQQLLVSVDGVIQKPNSGSSQPSEGFVLVGNDIIFSAAPHNGASIFVTVIGSTVGIGTPSNNTVTSDILQNGSVIEAKLATGAVTSTKIADGTIVNADINGSASIAGTKISPDFGSLNITTGGNITAPVLVAQGASGSGDGIILLNSGGGANNDFARIRQVLSDDTFRIENKTSGSYTSILTISSTGEATVPGLLNADGGLDVGGNITLTGTVDGVDIAALNTTVSNINTNLVADTTPQLGGDLDVNGNSIDFATDKTLSLKTGATNAVVNGITGHVQQGSLIVDGGNKDILFTGGSSGSKFTFGSADGATHEVMRITPSVLGASQHGKVELKYVTANAGGSTSSSLKLATTASGISISGDLLVSSTEPRIRLVDSDSNPDYSIYNSNGVFSIYDETNTSDRIVVNTDGHVDITGNLDVGAGLDVVGNCQITGNFLDGKGDLRSIPLNSQSSAYTLVAADAGKTVYVSSGGVTIPASVFSSGQAVTIINDSGSDQTLTQGSGLTLYNTGDAATGNRTLAGRGMATIYFPATATAYISGSGLS